MQLIGVTGGIAAGKTPIAKRLQELGARLLDADLLAREVVAAGEPALQQIHERFGERILMPDGTLDRKTLGSIVFGDPQALADLNAITHPAIRRLAHERIRGFLEEDSEAIVVYDIPLLVEAGTDFDWDLIVLAHAPRETRMHRLMNLRGMTEEEAAARIANQASDEERIAVADVVIDTSGTLAETIAQTDSVWERVSGSR